MNQLYKFFLDEIERIFNKEKLSCDNRIKKAREGYLVHPNIIQETNEKELSLDKALNNLSIDKFFREMDNNYNLDSQLTQEKAFLNCCLKFDINNEKIPISLLAEYKANEKIRTYCYDLMNIIRSNQNIKSSPYLDNLKEKTNHQYPIWQKKNQTEFMQLLEALILLDRIQPRPNQSKSELFIEIADFFGIQLSKNAESNLGKGRKTKLAPKLLHELYKIWIGKHKNLERK